MIFPPVGYCIYCGATESLTDEHIIPFGLSGTDKLLEASCTRCAAITSACERLLLQGPLWPVRVYRQLKSRRKHKSAPQEYPLTIVKDGVSQEVRLPLQEYPILVHFPVFTLAGHYQPTLYVSGIRMRGLATISFGRDPEEVALRLGAQQVSLTESQQPVAFARVVAKIGLGYAASAGALSRLARPSPVVAGILGQTDDVGRWVGTTAIGVRGPPGALHAIGVREEPTSGVLVADVQLFSDSQTPLYHVILGTLK